MKFASGTQDLPVAGTFSDKTLVGADYLISLSEWNEHFSERTDDRDPNPTCKEG